MKTRPNNRQGDVRRTAKQQGVALFVVIVLVMLSMLLALWSARSALFGEIIVGNDADYRRTFEAAQAMLQDAEFDVRGVRPDGSACVKDATKPDQCRPPPAPSVTGAEVYFDFETKDLENMVSTIATKNATVKCFKGICQKRSGSQDFWNESTTLSAMIASDTGARYGQFTGADAKSTANPILSNQTAEQGAWYWVEILPYVDANVALLGTLPAESNVLAFAPSRKRPWVYRITALARGNKPNTEVVLQSTLSIQIAE